jgi:hypothetical protein
MGKKRKGTASRAAIGSEQAIADGIGALDTALAGLWESVAAGDVLAAEVQASELLALPGLSDDGDDFHAQVADGLFRRSASVLAPPEQAAFLRVLMTLGTRAVKRQASEDLADLADDGVYPPEWVTGIGKAVSGQAYHARDVFGEQELVAVTFSYGDAEHAIAVALDLADLPTVIMAGLSKDSGNFLRGTQEDAVFGGRLEPITLAEARERIEAPLARYGSDPDYNLDPASAFAIPLIRSRVRRLPAPVPGASVTYTAADRAAVVAEFLASPLSAEAGQPDVARFWAQVLTGYSSRLPGEAPAAVGRRRLAAALLVHVPRTFRLSDEQRDGMRLAVTAWTRWAAARQGVDEKDAGTLLTDLDGKLDDFAAVYDDAENIALRGYVQDVVSPDVDLVWLADLRARRELAAPPPDDRDPDDEVIDATERAGRATLTEHEFASCAPEGSAGERFMAAASRVAEELWHDDAAETWQSAKPLLAKGDHRHDVLHALVSHNLSR